MYSTRSSLLVLRYTVVSTYIENATPSMYVELSTEVLRSTVTVMNVEKV